MNQSLIVLSGGQDSVTTFFTAQQTTDVVGAVHFFYGQQHGDSEFECATKLCNEEEVPLYLLDLSDSLGLISASALTTAGGDTNAPHPIFADLPASFVPCRNLIFLTMAAALAVKLGASQIWTGVCQMDYSGYPDCRDHTIDTLQTAINFGLGFDKIDLQIVTPLMNLTKAQTFELASNLGKLDYILENTHTGYTGARDHRYMWGWGPSLGTPLDPASEVRKKGYIEYVKSKGISDDVVEDIERGIL